MQVTNTLITVVICVAHTECLQLHGRIHNIMEIYSVAEYISFIPTKILSL